MNRKFWTTIRGAALGCCLLSASVARADTITLSSLANDAEATSDGMVLNAAATALRAGSATSATSGTGFSGRNPVYVFQLPTIATGQTISGADFSTFYLNNNSNAIYNVDLYGLGSRKSAAVLGTDYYVGNNADPTDATRLQTDFLASAARGTFNVTLSTDGAGDANLASYLNAQYAAGAQAGDFVFLRLSPDSTAPSTDASTKGYTFTSSESTTNAPVLTIQTSAVPEPATMTMLLLGLGGTAASTLRRKRRFTS